MSRYPRALAVMVVGLVSACFRPDNLPISLSSSERSLVYEAVLVHRRAIELYEHGNTADAIAVAEKALELLESALGVDHVYVAVPLRTLAVFHQSRGAYAEAEPRFARVVALEEKALGPDALAVAMPLDELAALYMQWGAYARAERLYARSLAIRKRTLGPTDPSIVDSLDHLALALDKQGQHSRAEPLYRGALELAQRVLGPRHADVARGLDGLAMLYWAQGTYAEAEPLLVQALEIRTGLLARIDRFGPTDITKISNLFTTPQSTRGSSPASVAVPLQIYANLIAELNTEAIRSLSNLEQLYSAVGVNARAEPLLARTADIYETVRMTARSEVAESVEHLRKLYVERGDYQRAEPLLVRALDDRQKRAGPMHPDVANSLNDLAQLYLTQGAYAKAEPLLARVLALREQALGKTHPDVARSLNNLALLYLAQGAYAKAEPLLVRAAGLVEQVLGPRHADLARCLNNLALLHHMQGAYRTAEPLYVRAIDIAANTPGGGYPDAVRYLTNLATLYQASGVYWQAEPLLARAVELRESRLDVELARLSAPRKQALMAALQQETESLVSLHADSTPISAPAFELALTVVLRRKGLALESLLDNQATLRSHLTTEVRDRLDRLAAANSELATLTHAPVDPATAAARASKIAAVRARVDGLESELNAASAVHHARSQPVTPAKIQAALAPGTALIELVRYHRFDPRPDQPRWHEARYAAYVLQARGAPRWVALGEAATIDAAVDAVLAGMRPDAGAEAARAALRRLDELLIDPLRDLLVDASHVIVSPDGKLNLVPFDALLDAQGRYELEHRLISYVTSGRELVQRVARRPPRSPTTIVAAPDYGPGKPFVHLANAAGEAAEVAAHFGDARVITGRRATKAALAALSGPAVLHVATHGFFAREVAAHQPPTAVGPARLAEPDAAERGMYVEGVLAPARQGFGDPANALDRAGLALADANVRADGIVTAREIASYDWWGTQLVVLSACETGVGVAPSGDGVYGLRRALALAGARSQVVSLWNVSDASVRALMREFYGELARGTGRAEALRRAKRWLLGQPKLAHPYYWAAFIPAGDWTPLDRTPMLPRRAR